MVAGRLPSAFWVKLFNRSSSATGNMTSATTMAWMLTIRDKIAAERGREGGREGGKEKREGGREGKEGGREGGREDNIHCTCIQQSQQGLKYYILNINKQVRVT